MGYSWNGVLLTAVLNIYMFLILFMMMIVSNGEFAYKCFFGCFFNGLSSYQTVCGSHLGCGRFG
jgi:hypothetical protein